MMWNKTQLKLIYGQIIVPEAKTVNTSGDYGYGLQFT